MEQKTATKNDLTSIGFFLVELTYSHLPTPIAIKLKCKIALDEDDKAARQAFYSQADGDIEKGKFAYHVDMLSRIVMEKPEGLPGFDDLMPDVREEGREYPTLAAAIIDYFSTGEPILRKIAGDALDRYNSVSQPDEFFR